MKTLDYVILITMGIGLFFMMPPDTIDTPGAMIFIVGFISLAIRGVWLFVFPPEE